MISDEQAAINRRQRIAEMLMAQGQEPMETNQQAGGYVVPVSPMAGVAKVAQQLAGAYVGRKADDKQADLNQKKADMVKAMINGDGPDYAAVADAVSPEAAINLYSTAQAHKQSHADKLEERRIAAEQTAAQRKSDQEFRAQQAELDRAQRFQQQRDMAQLTASLAAANRPAPQPVGWQVQQDNEGNLIQVHPQTGQVRQLGIKGKPTTLAAEKPLTEYQGKSMMFGTRAQEADKILRELTGKYSPEKINVAKSVENVPLVGWAANAGLGDNEQQAQQAQRDFVNAVLRQESGASISEGEFKNAIRQYFPQPGDNEAVIAQKAANRAKQIEGFKTVAGPSGSKSFEQPAEEDKKKKGSSGGWAIEEVK